MFVAPFEQGEIGPDLYLRACEFGLEGSGLETTRQTLSRRTLAALDQGKKPLARLNRASEGFVLVRILTSLGTLQLRGVD